MRGDANYMLETFIITLYSGVPKIRTVIEEFFSNLLF
jgi:hypothetical protein